MAVRRDRSWEIPEREATPPELYLRRRDVLRAMGIAAAGVLVPGCGRSEEAGSGPASPVRSPDGFATAEEPTAFEAASTYNNFYEFGTAKTDPSENAGGLVTQPWEVAVDGEVDLFGDGTVVLVPTPGHTVGHQSLLVRATPGTDADAALLVGDACYLRRMLASGITPKYATDVPGQLASYSTLQRYEASGVRLLFSHDIESWDAVPAGLQPTAPPTTSSTFASVRRKSGRTAAARSQKRRSASDAPAASRSRSIARTTRL